MKPPKHPACFAVVGSRSSHQGYSFSIWHDTFEQAKEEALRLAEKEQHEFIVLRVVGKARKKVVPTEFIEID